MRWTGRSSQKVSTLMDEVFELDITLQRPDVIALRDCLRNPNTPQNRELRAKLDKGLTGLLAPIGQDRFVWSKGVPEWVRSDENDRIEDGYDPRPAPTIHSNGRIVGWYPTTH